MFVFVFLRLVAAVDKNAFTLKASKATLIQLNITHTRNERFKEMNSQNIKENDNIIYIWAATGANIISNKSFESKHRNIYI